MGLINGLTLNQNASDEILVWKDNGFVHEGEGQEKNSVTKASTRDSAVLAVIKINFL